jgi:hypothetical protein
MRLGGHHAEYHDDVPPIDSYQSEGRAWRTEALSPSVPTGSTVGVVADHGAPRPHAALTSIVDITA